MPVPSPNRYHLLVEGYGLAAVMGAPGIDGTRTRSNHIIEVRYCNLGLVWFWPRRDPAATCAFR